MPDGVGSRRESRERALSLLYEADAKGVAPAAVLEALPLPPEVFAGELVVGVAEHQDEVDGLISRFARGWTLARMPVIDRTLLRMATFELAHRPDVPTGAVISEAVELAKRYSTDDSGRFVNGLLARIAQELRGEAPRATAAVDPPSPPVPLDQLPPIGEVELEDDPLSD